MQRRSPPKHRHDGTSPLPLGMDWSPSPRKWNGHDTIWPHDHRTGWSYCVTIPSWIFLPKSKDSDPIVFYRVQIGLQSPEGITTTRGILRRFNDFLKLFMDLKKSFPKKNLPPAPPKGLLRLKSRTLLEERKSSLEEWMTKLLSDLDLSRSVAVASFLELEATARTSFQDANEEPTEASPTGNSTSRLHQIPPTSSSSLTAGSSSVASDYGSDTAYEPSESRTKDENYEIGIEDLTLDETSPIEKLVKYGLSNIDEGLFLGQTILDQLEGFPKHKPHSRYLNNVVDNDNHGNTSRQQCLTSNGPELYFGIEPVKLLGHTRKLSSESIGSDGSSLRGCEISNSGMPNSFGDGSVDFHRGAVLSSAADNIDSRELQNSSDVQVVLPVDQRHKMNRFLLTMQQRLATAKTDMDDLISRLNQEMAVKDFLATKVKALEVELEASKQKNKENLQQAISFEREKLTQMQWDMEELKRKSLEMELKLKSKEDGKPEIRPKVETSDQEKDMLLEELNVTRKQLENLSKRYEELGAKSKADIKYLAKEFKSVKGSHNEMKQELDQSLKEKSKLEKLLKEEREAHRCEKNAQEKLLKDCRVLCDQLQDWKPDLPCEDEDATMDWHVSDALDVLSTGDNKISLVLSEVLKLIEDGRNPTGKDYMMATEGELRTVLASIFSHHAKLMKQVNNSVTYRASQKRTIAMNNDEASAENVNHVER